MIEAGISEGDTVIVKKTDSAENGKIVVALIDDWTHKILQRILQVAVFQQVKIRLLKNLMLK